MPVSITGTVDNVTRGRLGVERKHGSAVQSEGFVEAELEGAEIIRPSV